MAYSKKEIVIATENKGKIVELKKFFENTNFIPRFLSEFKDQMGDIEIFENGKTFEGNALIKAIIVGNKIGMLTLADDSGICVDSLNGSPGVYSARYSEEKTDIANNEKLLKEMLDIPEDQRGCHYNCTVAIYDPTTHFVQTVSGQWHGRIAKEPRGTKSFGYAPIFLSKESDYKKTNAEFEHDHLIDVNHRGKAFKKAVEILNAYIGL
jgi:non-canonical purine NTP pyrophosphatase (RdgB/HAM1 family)